ncbi:MAG TPA: BamA/TamA family outer membrane protein, partial [Vicinamibacterales bacterium]
LVFSEFENDGHVIYAMEPADIVAQVAPEAGMRAAVLPGRSVPGGDVQRMLDDSARGLPAAGAAVDSTPYDQKLKLEVLSQPMITGGVSSYGGFIAGGMSAVFSDMLGDRALWVGAQVSGTLADFGGQLAYVNRKHRWNWAASVEQTPYRVGYLTLTEDPVEGEILLTEVVERQTNRGVFGTTAYPFSHATRFEVSGGARALTFTRDLHTRVYSMASLQQIDRRNSRVTTADPLYLAETNAAIVHDTTIHGAISPVFGARYRLEVGRSVGSLNYTTAHLDWRRYFMPARPVTVAIRGIHYGRYGRDNEHPQLVDLYAGYPEFVRGYGFGSFNGSECLDGVAGRECAVFDSLIGSRMLVGNIEVRAPLVGLFRRNLEYGRMPVEVAGFVDAGVTWTDRAVPSFAGGARRPVRSAGVAVRANAFGIIMLELSVARPFDRVDKSLQWQLGIRQGF